MTNLTKKQLQQQIEDLRIDMNIRETDRIQIFNTDFTTEGLYTDRTEYGSRVGIHILRDDKKRFVLLNENLSTKNYQFTDMENIFLNLIGEFSDKCNLFYIVNTENKYVHRMANIADGYKFCTSHLYKMEKNKLFSRKQIFAILRGLEKKNVISLEWYIDNISKRLIWVHFTKEFLQERACFETKEDAKNYGTKSDKIQKLVMDYMEKEEATKNV